MLIPCQYCRIPAGDVIRCGSSSCAGYSNGTLSAGWRLVVTLSLINNRGYHGTHSHHWYNSGTETSSVSIGKCIGTKDLKLWSSTQLQRASDHRPISNGEILNSWKNNIKILLLKTYQTPAAISHISLQDSYDYIYEESYIHFLIKSKNPKPV